jgi:ABC-type phosphate transport system substrate-binding protein
MRRRATIVSCATAVYLVVMGLTGTPAQALEHETVVWDSVYCRSTGSFEEGSWYTSECAESGAPGYLAGHMINDAGGSEDYKASSSGDYCSYLGLSKSVNKPESETTLFNDKYVKPLSEYQEGDGLEDLCANWPRIDQEETSYKYVCAPGRTKICYFGPPVANGGRGCVPEEELCQCGFNGFSCECLNSGDGCWACVPSGCGEAIERVPCSAAELQELKERGERCETEVVHPEEPSGWGFKLTTNNTGNEVGGTQCPTTCAMQHYVSLAGRGLADRPFGAYFGNPELTVEQTVKPLVEIPASSAKAWGYVCPVLEDASTGDIIELCLEEWRGTGNGAEWQSEHVGACTAPTGLNHDVDRVITLFASGTHFASEHSGSSNTEVAAGSFSPKSFGASISAADLENVVKADDETCHRSSSATPSSWALIGIASGIEQLEGIPKAGETPGTRQIEEEQSQLAVETVYTPRPVEISGEAVTGITGEHAEVTAEINPYGGYVSYIVEYGTTNSYGYHTAETYIGKEGATPVAVGSMLTKLAPNTTYHYRIKAGATYGPDEIFATPPVPPTATTGLASSLQTTTATLNATVNPGGAAVSECRFEYGTTTAYGASAPCASSPPAGNQPVAVAAAVSGLSKGTSYHFRVVAANVAGSAKGSDGTFATRPYLATLETWPTTAITETVATMRAGVNPMSEAVSSCVFEYGTTTAYGTTVPCAALPEAGEKPVEVSARLEGLSKGTTYHYRLVVTDTAGVARSADGTFTTLPIVPAVVTEKVSSDAESTATLNATVNPEDSAVSSCRFEYGTSGSYGSTVSCASAPGSGANPVHVSAAVHALKVDSEYHFRIVATNALGTSYGADAMFVTAGALCNGIQHLQGAGATLQSWAQTHIWNVEFNKSANPTACGGPEGHLGYEPVVSFRATGSVQGMEEWGLNKHQFETGTDFVATDEPPDTLQKKEIEEHMSSGSLETIPVLQTAVAIIMHLPAGCTATSVPAPGRLVLTNSTLQHIWAGDIKTWGEVISASSEGAGAAANDKLTGTGCSEAKVARIVRRDGAGTTHILKKYLGLIAQGALYIASGNSATWSQLSQGASNTTWPQSAEVVEQESEGDNALVETVAKTPGSIGYAALTDARLNTNASHPFVPPLGGAGTQTFWTPIEDKPGAYADPSADYETYSTPTHANCEQTAYTNGTSVFPPKTTEDLWNEVTTSTSEPNYSICAFSYDLAFTDYAATPFQQAGNEVSTTVQGYLKFELATESGGGQTLINAGQDYQELTSQTLTIAVKGVKKIKD